jgi:type I restriction enzyme S subunit
VTALRPYPKYRPSGVPWLGDVPEHWDTERGKWLFRRVERPVRPEDDVVTCFRDGAVTLRKNRRVRGFTEALKEIGYQGIRRGDLVIHAMDGFAGAIGVSDSDGKGSPVYSVCTPSADVNPHFYAYLLREMARNGWILALAKGIRERSTDFRFDDFGGQRVPFPPRACQDADVLYLDHIDRRIRKYIRAKQKLIALLNEMKQAIIHQAVTGQIDVRTGKPYPKYKPSGVPWLGDVPEHWEVRRLKSLMAAPITDGPHTTPRFLHEGIPFLSVDGIQDGELVFDRCRRVSLDDHAEFSKKTKPRRDDILLGKAASTGKIARVKVDFEFSVWSPLALIRPDAGQTAAAYLEYSLKDSSAQAQVETLCTFNTQRNISMDDIPKLAIPLPPRPEQEAIVRQIATVVERMSPPIIATGREADLLREYRTRLVADVVTGKLDVREAAVNLPDEPEEVEEPDGSESPVESDDDNEAATEAGEDES